MLAFQLKSHQQNEPIAQFYIQCKGLHSGRPLRKAIPNCFSVYTNTPNMFEMVYVLYIGGLFNPYIKGSVVPFITLGDASGIIRENGHILSNQKLFSQIEAIDSLLQVTKQKINLIQQMQVAYCLEALKRK
jgi:hypothetical protein